jgi:tetratricopeptide (TPR) repeat protein
MKLSYLFTVSSFDTFLSFDRLRMSGKTLRTNGGKKPPHIISSARPECHEVVYRRVKSIILLLGIIPLGTLTAPSMEKAAEYQKNEQFTDAIACYEEIVMHEANNANAWFNLGHCYLSLGYGEKALAAFDKISYALPARYNAAYTHKTIGNLSTAIERYKEIIQENPDYEPAHLALGFAYITQGNFELGWKQHERYLKRSGKNGDKLRALLQNHAIPYKTILLHPEGGLGDTLQFVRYAERLKNMGAHIIVACQKSLIPLLSRCLYIDQLIPCDGTVPTYDADATLMSLPAIFADDETSVPQNIPYLHADPQLVSAWQQKLAADKNFKIGICWEVNAHNDVSRLPIARRGCPLQHFADLQNISGVSFYSLQKYDGVEQLSNLPAQFKLHTFNDLDEHSGPFMDTAALMKNLDLIITVDTAMVHLAGGLGCKVWLLHPYATADWRWICHRTDSHWYPTLRIFKQQKPFDWNGVMENVKTELNSLLMQQ